MCASFLKGKNGIFEKNVIKTLQFTKVFRETKSGWCNTLELSTGGAMSTSDLKGQGKGSGSRNPRGIKRR